MAAIIHINNRFICLAVVIFSSVIFTIFYTIAKFQLNQKCEQCEGCEDFAKILQNTTYDPIRATPLIFVGGEPRSGTTLMRALLDVHPDVDCGLETWIIPQMLREHHLFFVSPTNKQALQATGLRSHVVDNAYAKFFGEIITKHGGPTNRYCNKDPQTMQYATFLKRLFPNSKFIFMIRDGRATVNSIIANNVDVQQYDLTDYRQSMQRWNLNMEHMIDECHNIGDDHCLKVYYEQLVLRPKETMEKVLNYLGLPWSDNVLHHEKFINKTDGIPISSFEYSSKQIAQPIYQTSLNAWVGQLPEDVVRDMAQLAPALAELGYDPQLNATDYEKLAFYS